MPIYKDSNQTKRSIVKTNIVKGENMKFIFRLLMLLNLVLMLNACAFDVVRLKHIPVELQASSGCVDKFTLAHDTKVDAGPGYSRVLKSGTRWDCVGRIPQGKVFKTKDQILTVEASNVFEANIVVKDQQLVGYYLPVERSFSPLDEPQKLPVD
jgi:hypothetical protein